MVPLLHIRHTLRQCIVEEEVHFGVTKELITVGRVNHNDLHGCAGSHLAVCVLNLISLLHGSLVSAQLRVKEESQMNKCK